MDRIHKIEIQRIVKHILCFIGFPLLVLFLIGGVFFIEIPKLTCEFYDTIIMDMVRDFKYGMKKDNEKKRKE